MAPASAASPAEGTSGGAHEPPRGISLPSAQAAARRLVCERQCAYHKPEKISEEPCAAFILLAGQRGLLSPDGVAARFPPRGKEPPRNVNENDPRLLVVCALCSFPPDGCDFRSPRFLKPAGTCEPCGGLRVLAGLLDAGVDFADPFLP
jgi:hypothetical protein